MKFAIFCVLTLATVASAGDDCKNKDLLKCYNLEQYLVDHRFKLPEDDADVVDLCEKLSAGGKCLYDFNERCSKHFEDKQLLRAELKALKEYSHEVCDSEEGRAEFLKRTECYSNKDLQDEHFTQHHIYVRIIENIPLTEKDKWVHQVCCADLYARESGRATDAKYCSKEVVDYLNALIQKIFAPRFRYHCEEVKTYEKCVSKLPGDIKTTIQKIVAKNPPTKNLYALPTLYKLWRDGGFGY